MTDHLSTRFSFAERFSYCGIIFTPVSGGALWWAEWPLQTGGTVAGYGASAGRALLALITSLRTVNAQPQIPLVEATAKLSNQEVIDIGDAEAQLRLDCSQGGHTGRSFAFFDL
ncbi:MAG: hypothetical protein EAZ99_19040 [Alphaproteobacteria bacterium]|nr:MAG: hypothetical protein EAZ99_19040 [Alphaproteobacteria bacterium]